MNAIPRVSSNSRLPTALIAVLLSLGPSGVLAESQAEPSPTPAATQTMAPSSATAPVWHNPPYTNLSIIDPCGGPKELLSKINPSPCVLVEGEALFFAGYANVNTHGNVSVSGPQSGFELPISGNANIYPNLAMAFGVSATSQIQITMPSDVDVSTQRLGSASAATNTAFNYKQLVYFSQTKFTLAAVDLGYIAPTGNSFGPSYSIQPILFQPLSPDVGIGGAWTFQNSASPVGPGSTQRGWSDPLLLYLSWSPARSSFAFFPVVSHNFNPNRTSIILDGAQLFGRHFLFNVEYGGLGLSAAATGPFNHTFTFAADANPRIFAATIYYLMGESNLPPQQPAPTPTP